MIFLMDNPFLPDTHATVVFCSILWNIGLYAMIVNMAAQFVYRMNIFCLSRSIRMNRFFGGFLLYFLWTCCHSFGILITFNGENVETTRELRNKSPLFKRGQIPPYIYINSVCFELVSKMLGTVVFRKCTTYLKKFLARNRHAFPFFGRSTDHCTCLRNCNLLCHPHKT